MSPSAAQRHRNMPYPARLGSRRAASIRRMGMIALAVISVMGGHSSFAWLQGWTWQTLSRGTSSARQGCHLLSALDKDLEDVILVPLEEEVKETVSWDDFEVEPQSASDIDKAEALQPSMRSLRRTNRSKAGRSPGDVRDDIKRAASAVLNTQAEQKKKNGRKGPGGMFSEKLIDTLSLAPNFRVNQIDPLGPGPTITTVEAPIAPTPEKSAARKKGWLVGKRDSKRMKLIQNSALQKWLLKKGVWVSEAADWGRESHVCAMAVETRQERENECSGRGLVARRDINEYEELVRVPMDVTLTKENAENLFGKDVIAEDMSEYSAIAFQLIHEKFVQGPDSDYKPYIDVLPEVSEIGQSFTWPEEDFEHLRGSQLVNMSKFLKERLMTEYKDMEEKVFSKFPEKFPAKHFTFDNFLWAYAILFSRGVRLDFPDRDAFVALVPYIDLINHAADSKTFITGVFGGAEIEGIRHKERFITVLADKFYDKYQQIFISYGPKSNAQLTMLYGFAFEVNKEDFVEVTMSHLLKGSPFLKEKDAWIKAKDIDYRTFPLYRDRVTQEMMMFLRLVVAQPEDFNLAPDDNIGMRDALARTDLKKAIDEATERRALLVLRGLVEEQLNDYPTTVKDDEALVSDKMMFELLPKNQRNAIRVRFGEKQILTATINAVNRRLNNLARLTEIQTERATKRRANKHTMMGRLGLDWDPAIKSVPKNFEELMEELEI